jgi:choice-of-anchor B domain-containing protein
MKQNISFMKQIKFLASLSFLLFFLSQDLLMAQTEGLLLDNWRDTTGIDVGRRNQRFNECWGFVSNEIEFGVIGSTMGTHFINLETTDSAFQEAFVPGRFFGSGVVHRDFHDYKGFLYGVCDQGNSSLQVIDIQNLPDTAFLVHEDTVNIRRAHNLFIDSAAARLYTCGVREPSGTRIPIQVWSLDNPEMPVLLRNIFEIQGVDINYVHDMYARNDTLFMNAAWQGLIIADMSDVDNPNLLGLMSMYPEAGYNHSGWWNERGDRYYLADETHGRDIKIVDVSNIQAPQVIQLIEAESDPEGSIPHNLIVKDDVLYVSYYYDGLQIFDVSGDTTACRAYNYPTSELDPVPGGFAGAWGVYPLLPSGKILVSDMQNGLFIVELPELSPSDTFDMDGTPPCQTIASNLSNEQMLSSVALIQNISTHTYALTGLSLEGSLFFYNEIGQMVYTENIKGISKYDLPINRLKNGIHFLEFRGENESKVFKINVLYSQF